MLIVNSLTHPQCRAPRPVVSRSAIPASNENFSLDLYFSISIFPFFQFSMYSRSHAHNTRVRGRRTKALFGKNLLLRTGDRKRAAYDMQHSLLYVPRVVPVHIQYTNTWTDTYIDALFGVSQHCSECSFATFTSVFS